MEQKIRVKLVDDDEHEPDKDFFVDLNFVDEKQPPGHKLGEVRPLCGLQIRILIKNVFIN